ncbi:MAG: RES family NAD+ phosphorylase [Longimicrobiaceae bacterium]
MTAEIPVPPRGLEAVDDLAYAISAAPLRGIDMTLCRAVRAHHLEKSPPEPLYFEGSARVGARFTPLGGPAGLYLAADQVTAFAEIRDLFFDSKRIPRGLKPHDPIVLVYVRTVVNGILDLTDASVRRRLRVGRAALRGSWRRAMHAYLAGRGSLPFTQQLALAAHLTGRVSGIWYDSTRAHRGHCLVVFPDRLSAAAGDLVEVHDTTGKYAQRLPGP